ncbi:MaoC family dehydratase [Neobacillus niacini]|uniref:MaoC family dehydratase n=1 Tax=Neobacillus niacini TaxID=86668 RepID=UPI0030017EDF
MAIYSSRGKYYEEINVGDVFKHSITRTVTEMDNLLFSALTHNPDALHLDAEYGKETTYGSIIVNSCYTLSFVVGVHVPDVLLRTSLGNLGYEKIKFPAPVRIGDTLRAESEVLKKRESKSRPEAGIVWFEHRGYNQREELVFIATRVGMMKKLPDQ